MEESIGLGMYDQNGNEVPATRENGLNPELTYEDTVKLFEYYKFWNQAFNGGVSVEKLDLVVAIRCRNCVYYDGFDCTRLDLQLIDPDNYCSWGERKVKK